MSKPAPLIAHVIFSLRMGGLENGLVNLINRMPSDRYRHAVICLTDYDNFSERINQEKVSIVELNKRQGKDLGWYVRLWRVLRQLKPDVVHTRNLPTMEAQLVACFRGIPYRVHSEHGWDMYDLKGSSFKYRLLRKFVKPCVHHFIALSRELEEYLNRDIGVAQSNLSRICNGVDSEKFRPVNHQHEPIQGWVRRQGEIVIGSVGRMEEVKDPLNLVSAFLKVLEWRPGLRDNLRLVIAGDGGLREEANHRLSEAGALAWLPGSRDDIPELMRAMDVFVLPSMAEGISNTILEAMASGLPIAATSVGGNGELLEEGECGYLVPPGDSEALAKALLRYVDHSHLRIQHGARARQRVEELFSIERMVEKYMAVYDQVLA